MAFPVAPHSPQNEHDNSEISEYALKYLGSTIQAAKSWNEVSVHQKSVPLAT